MQSPRAAGRRKTTKGAIFCCRISNLRTNFFFSSTNPNMQFKFGIQIKRRNRSKRYTKILQRKTNTCNLKTQQRNQKAFRWHHQWQWMNIRFQDINRNDEIRVLRNEPSGKPAMDLLPKSLLLSGFLSFAVRLSSCPERVREDSLHYIA